jgi:hypothetical protein
MLMEELRSRTDRQFTSLPRCVCMYSQAEAAAAAKAKFVRSDTGAGAEVKPLLISIACGLVLWFIPPPAAVAIKAWKLLAIFVGTIVAIITTVRLHGPLVLWPVEPCARALSPVNCVPLR